MGCLVVGAAVDSPSQTAISGYAGLLRSLRSNVVSPHTHSCRLGVCFVLRVSLDSPSETAISGYASLLRSLRSNVVDPHTHSCRFSWGVGLQVVDAQKLYRFTTQQACTGSRAHISFAAPMVGASSRQHWSEATGGGRRTRQRGGLSQRRAQSPIRRMAEEPKIFSPKQLESDPN